jgi:hypothetical protein
MAVRTRGNVTLEISDDNGATWSKVPEPKNASFQGQGSNIDITNFDSGDWEEHVGDRASGSIQYSGNFLPNNTVLGKLRTSWATRATIKVRLSIGKAPNPVEMFKFDCTVDNYSANTGDVVEASCQFASTGAITA